ncbi:MAG: hypothetical protein PHN38_08560 [Sulfurospirillaceae bacterium]|nr:hypothetical protein [Sulfurospirillaceae bacterium]MDD3462912.1 hypothetical protein [Sulfurospirillaceae bacterium]
MYKKEILLEDALLLIEQNFYFLHMGEFFGALSKTVELDATAFPIVRKYDVGQEYRFNPMVIQELLNNARSMKNDDITLFDYFVEFNAFRGICMAMVESLRLESDFCNFMKERLGGRYEDFFDIVSFVRNVLSHNIHAEIRLSEKDFDGTLKRIRRLKRDENVFFSFNYALDLPEILAPNPQYGFTCNIDFSSLNEGMEFLSILSMWDLMMLCELCFNLVMSYKLYKNS